MIFGKLRVFLLFVSDQLWTYNISGALELRNKVDGLQSGKWMIPLEEREGYIESLNNQQKVLGFKQKVDCSFGYKIKKEKRGEVKTRTGCEDANKSQKWIRSKSDEKGFFTIKNLGNGLLLSSKGSKKLVASGTVVCDWDGTLTT